ncbi:MAG TPA: glutamate synthase subunit beta [Armatimonadota bacterium]|nr:glutamate synthase subunit beta [Armatimonadota bacterium]
MGNPRGFLIHNRALPQDRNPKERIQDWNEFHVTHNLEDLRTQGARCMDCGTPFCHSGIILNGMASGCPLNNLIPEWNDLVYRGLWQEAVKRLLKTNNFPEFTGRVCPATCEGSCTLGSIKPAVAIKSIEYSLIEYAFDQGWIKPEPPSVSTGKRVAVVGSGPAGLACADQLNKAGHSVTVFERDDRLGGLLMYGIPNMKLDKMYVVQRRMHILAAEGIEFITGVEVGKDYPISKLHSEFDAVVLCCGARKPRDIDVSGRHLTGIHFALEFLESNTRNILDADYQLEQDLSATDKHVVVIGGGDTGTDCIATSIRQKCKSVIQLEILPEPPLERTPDNPWPEWPKTLKVDYGQEEAISLFGQDPRIYCVSTTGFIGNSNGHVMGVQTIQVKWEQMNGRPVPVNMPGTEKEYPADLVLLAMGFLGPEDVLIEQSGIERDARSNVKTTAGSYMTNIPGIFTAGDMRRGQSLVVWAIREGRAAARECDIYLMGSTELPE